MKRLDRVQTECLRNLATTCKGTWDCYSDWRWGSDVKTEKVMEALRVRGLVNKTGEFRGFGMYEITEAGRKHVETELVAA